MQNVLSQGQHDQRDMEELIAALQNEYDGIRATAAQELGELGNRQAVEPLLAALSDPYSSLVRYQAAKALGKLGDVRAVEPLIASLNHLDMNTQVEAAKALGNLDDPRAIEALSARMKTGSDRLFKASAEALEKLGGSTIVRAEQVRRAKRGGRVKMMKRGGFLIACTLYLIGPIARFLDGFVTVLATWIIRSKNEGLCQHDHSFPLARNSIEGQWEPVLLAGKQEEDSIRQEQRILGSMRSGKPKRYRARSLLS